MTEMSNDVKAPVEADTTTTDSSTVETNAGTDDFKDDEFVLEFNDEPEASPKTEEAPESDEEAPEVEDKGDSEPQDPEEKSTRADKRKQQLNNEIRDKVAERNALRREIAELNRQKYQMQSFDDLPTVEALMEQQNPDTGDYYTRSEAKLARIEAERELERKQRQLDEYTDNIVDNRIRLQDEASRALKDFPIFDSESDSYNKDLAEQANSIAEGLLIRDDAGEIIGSNGSIYNLYAAIASAAQYAETSGKIAGRKAAMEMQNRTDIGGSTKAPSSNTKEDEEFLSGFMDD